MGKLARQETRAEEEERARQLRIQQEKGEGHECRQGPRERIKWADMEEDGQFGGGEFVWRLGDLGTKQGGKQRQQSNEAEEKFETEEDSAAHHSRDRRRQSDGARASKWQAGQQEQEEHKKIQEKVENDPRLGLRGKECWETKTDGGEEQKEQGERRTEADGDEEVIGGDSTEGSTDRDKRGD